MLSDLNEIQDSSNEVVQRVNVEFSIQTRDQSQEEIVEKVYTFSFAQEWDIWTFSEYLERRTEDTVKISDRDWRQAQHIFWDEVNKTPHIDVPPEVADKLAEVTGAGSVTIQVPRGSIEKNEPEVVHEATN